MSMDQAFSSKSKLDRKKVKINLYLSFLCSFLEGENMSFVQKKGSNVPPGLGFRMKHPSKR